MTYRTGKEWLNLLKDQTLKNKIKDYIEEGKKLNDFHGSLHAFLTSAFVWRKTPEGWRYWRQLRNDIRDNPENYLINKYNKIENNYNI